MLTQFPAPFAARHAIGAEQQEGDAEQLSLVETDELLHLNFPRFLHLFAELHDEAESEDGGETPTEEVARTDLLRQPAIERDADEENEQIGECFIDLGRMTRE